MGRKNKEISVYTRLIEHPNVFRVDNGILFCNFCDHSIEWSRKSTVDNHCKSEAHKKNQRVHESNNNQHNNYQQQTLLSAISSNESRKVVIEDLIEAFASADIPLEKVNKLLPFFKKYLHEGGSIPQVSTLRQIYLPRVFENHHKKLLSLFEDKPVAIIMDELSDDCSRSVVNTLFCYQDITKLVSVDFLTHVNNTTIGQTCVNVITTFKIPLSSPRVFVSDSAQYMKKSFREVLKPLMPQLIHIPCCAHILHLIG